jgi:hypothetical protein
LLHGWKLNATADLGNINLSFMALRPYIGEVASLIAGTDISLGSGEAAFLTAVAGRDIILPYEGFNSAPYRLKYLLFNSAVLNAAQNINVAGTLVAESLSTTGNVVMASTGLLTTPADGTLADGSGGGTGTPPTPISAQSIAPVALVDIPVSLPALNSPGSLAVNIDSPSLSSPSPAIQSGSSLAPDASAAINAAEQSGSATDSGEPIGIAADGGPQDSAGQSSIGNGPLLTLSGGRGPAQELDFGRGSGYGFNLDVLTVLHGDGDCPTLGNCSRDRARR